MRIINLLVLLFLLNHRIYSSIYEVCIENAGLADQNTFEFDICIKGIGSPFELTSYQCALTFYTKITNGGTLSFSYIPGSSTIHSAPDYGIGINTKEGISKLTFASMPGSDLIDTTRKRIGRFKLKNTLPFGANLLSIINLMWNFEGAVTTIFTGTNFTNITTPVNHLSKLHSLNKLPVSYVIASDTAEEGPGKAIDGFGFFDGVPNSYWNAVPVPQWISFDLGAEKIVSLTRFSFYNFNNGRKYIYKILTSTDNLNWSEVINDTSDLIEYTENKFNPHPARYVRLLLLSNNQNNWASLWEAEIWGEENAGTPVDLISFNGYAAKDKITLNWTTGSELNNKGFFIERSINHGNLEKLDFIPGQGTTTEFYQYIYLDEYLNPGRYSYRLKQIDYDGSYTYSDVIDFDIAETAGSFSLHQNYPNPFNPSTNIQFSLPADQNVKLTVYNILGEIVEVLVDKELKKGDHLVAFSGENLASGIYLYRLDAGLNYTEIRKMNLIK